MRQAHGHGREPADVYAGGEHLLIGNAGHALSCDRYLMAAVGEGIREIENVPLLATYIRWKKLGEQENTHHSSPIGGFVIGTFVVGTAGYVTGHKDPGQA